MEEEPDYGKCVNQECQWFGYSFAPPPKSERSRCCPSCGKELEKWELKERFTVDEQQS